MYALPFIFTCAIGRNARGGAKGGGLPRGILVFFERAVEGALADLICVCSKIDVGVLDGRVVDEFKNDDDVGSRAVACQREVVRRSLSVGNELDVREVVEEI